MALALLSCLVLAALTSGCGEGRLVERTPGGDGDDGARGGDGGGGKEAPGPRVTITYPENGALLPSNPVEVRGTVEPPGAPVQVNGAEARATAGGEFRVRLSLPEGENRLVATSGKASSEPVTVVVDTRAPVIALESPPRGTTVVLDPATPPAAWPHLVFRGTVRDTVSGVATLSVDGQPVAFGGDGFFTTRVPVRRGLATHIVEAMDRAGHTATATRSSLAGAFRDPDAAVEQAVVARAEEETFDVAESALEDHVRATGIDAFLAGRGGGDFEVRSASFSDVDIDLDPRPGLLHVTFTLYGLVVDVRVRWDAGLFTVSRDGQVFSDPAVMNADLMVTPTLDGTVAVTMTNPDVELHGFHFDIEDFPGFLEDWLRDTVRDMVERSMEEAMDSMVVDGLFDPAMLERSAEVLGHRLRFGFAIRRVDLDDAGGRVTLDGTAGGEGPGGPGVSASGSYATPSPPPPLAGNSPALRIAIADDYLNLVSFQAWTAGVLRQRIGPGGSLALPMDLSVGLLDAGLEGALEAAGVAPDTPAAVALRPLLPPLVEVNAPPAATPLTVYLGDLLVDFLAVPEGGEERLLCSVAVAVSAGVAIEVVGTGVAPRIEPAMVVADLAEEPVTDLGDEAAEELVEALLRLALPALAEGMGGGQDQTGADELPVAFQGVSLEDVTVVADGDYLLLQGRPVRRP